MRRESSSSKYRIVTANRLYARGCPMPANIESESASRRGNATPSPSTCSASLPTTSTRQSCSSRALFFKSSAMRNRHDTSMDRARPRRWNERLAHDCLETLKLSRAAIDVTAARPDRSDGRQQPRRSVRPPESKPFSAAWRARRARSSSRCSATSRQSRTDLRSKRLAAAALPNGRTSGDILRNRKYALSEPKPSSCNERWAATAPNGISELYA